MKSKKTCIYIVTILIVLIGLIFVLLYPKLLYSKSKENTKIHIGELGRNITNVDTFKNSKFPLLAKLPEKNFYIYGINKNDNNYKGVIIKFGKNIKKYDLNYMTPMFILPKLMVMKNNKEDIIFSSFNTASGSEVYIEDLYGFYIDSKNSLEKIYFSPEDYKAQLNKSIAYNLQDSHLLALTIDGTKTFNINLENLVDPNWKFDKISYGNNVSFIFNKGIKIHIGLEAYFKDIVTPQYIGEIQADVIFNNKDKSFILENITFKNK